MYDIEVREIRSINLAVIEHKGDYKNIYKIFDRVQKYMIHKEILTPKTRAFALYYDDPDHVEEDKLRAKAGFTVSEDFQDDGEVKKHTIDSGQYACIKYKGPYSGLQKLYVWFYGNWLVNSRYDINGYNPIEEYLNDPRDTNPSDLRTNIYISLR